jgi:hypothetical protein
MGLIGHQMNLGAVASQRDDRAEPGSTLNRATRVVLGFRGNRPEPRPEVLTA